MQHHSDGVVPLLGAAMLAGVFALAMRYTDPAAERQRNLERDAKLKSHILALTPNLSDGQRGEIYGAVVRGPDMANCNAMNSDAYEVCRSAMWRHWEDVSVANSNQQRTNNDAAAQMMLDASGAAQAVTPR